jgi:hypothetical protein
LIIQAANSIMNVDRAHLAIIREFDNMLAQMDALWLSSLVTESQYARGVYERKRRILRLAGQIRQIASRAVLAARRMETAGSIADSDGTATGETEALAASSANGKPDELFTSSHESEP